MAESPTTAADDERAPAAGDEAEVYSIEEAAAEPAPPPRGTPWVTIVLAAANVVVWLVTVALGASIWMPSPQWMFEHGGNAGEVTLDGQPWRLFTSMFLHYGVLHVGMNMIGLVFGGRLVERLYGRLGLATIYLVSGLASSLVTALRPGVVSAGASGAIFGVLGALAAFYALHRGRMDQHLAKEVSGLVVFTVYSFLGGFQGEGVDLHAHVGGLVAGFACGFAIEVKRAAGAPRLSRTVFVGLLGLGVVVAGAVLAPAPVGAVRAAVQELAAAEEQILERWLALASEASAGRLGEDQLAGAIESELLPRWRAMREAFERSGAGAELRAGLLAYLRAREEGWELMARGLRARDAEAVQRGMKRFEEAIVPPGEPAPR